MKAAMAHLDDIFSALADGTRRDILTMLLEDDMAVTDVAEPLKNKAASWTDKPRPQSRSSKSSARMLSAMPPRTARGGAPFPSPISHKITQLGVR